MNKGKLVFAIELCGYPANLPSHCMVLVLHSKPGGHVKFKAGVEVVGDFVVAGMEVVLMVEVVVLLEVVQIYEPSVL